MAKKHKSIYRSDGNQIYRDDIHIANWVEDGYKCLEEFKNFNMTLGRWAKNNKHHNPYQFPSGGDGEVIEEEEVEEDTYKFPSKDFSKEVVFDRKEVEISKTAPEKLPSLGDLTPEYVEWYGDSYDIKRFEQKYRNHIRAGIEPVSSIYNKLKQ